MRSRISARIGHNLPTWLRKPRRLSVLSISMRLPIVATSTAPRFCEQANITVTLPKPMTSGAKADGRFGKQDFAYLPAEDVYRCPAGEKLTYHYTNEEAGK